MQTHAGKSGGEKTAGSAEKTPGATTPSTFEKRLLEEKRAFPAVASIRGKSLREVIEEVNESKVPVAGKFVLGEIKGEKEPTYKGVPFVRFDYRKLGGEHTDRYDVSHLTITGAIIRETAEYVEKKYGVKLGIDAVDILQNHHGPASLLSAEFEVNGEGKRISSVARGGGWVEITPGSLEEMIPATITFFGSSGTYQAIDKGYQEGINEDARKLTEDCLITEGIMMTTAKVDLTKEIPFRG